MYKCKNCDKEKYTILNLSCKHQICLSCLIKLTNIECPICHKNLVNDIPKEIIDIIKNPYSSGRSICPYHNKDIDCDASCFP